MDIGGLLLRDTCVEHNTEQSNTSSAKVKNTYSYSLNHLQGAALFAEVNGLSVSHFIGLFLEQTLNIRLMKLRATLHVVGADTDTPNTVINYISSLQPVSHRVNHRGLPGYSMGHKKSCNFTASAAPLASDW
jgi:hypothetical protein